MKTLQDVKVGDLVVKSRPYGSPDWDALVVLSVTPTRIKAGGCEWNKDHGDKRGAGKWDRETIYCDDEPRYVAWLAANTALAERLAPLLHKLPASDLRQLAAKLGVKL